MKSPAKANPSSKSIPAGSVANEDSDRIRVMLVDDHPLMRRGMKALIELQRRFVVCGEADSAPQALDLADKLQPDVAVVDISLKSTNGIELTKGLRVQVPSMQVLILSMHDEEVYAERALRAGAMGYLMKNEAGDNIIAAIDRIMQGDIHVSDRLKERMLHRFVQHRETPASPMEKLSDREMEVFELLGDGYGTRDIAQLLNLSVKTIDSYREHLKEKLGLNSGGDLVRHAIQWMRSQAI